MKRPSLVISLILLAALGVLASASLFTVHQTQQALVLQFATRAASLLMPVYI